MPPNCFRLGGNDKDRKKKRWQQNQLECHFPPLSMLAEPWARPIGARLCPTAPSHHPECVSKGTQSSRLRTERWPGLPCFKNKTNTKKKEKRKKKGKQYNTENQFVLISTFRIPLTLRCTPALSVIPNSAKERIKKMCKWSRKPGTCSCVPTRRCTKEQKHRVKACSGAHRAALGTESTDCGSY